MGNLSEISQWEAGVYQIELNDSVIAGPDGIANIQGKQLANRTQWLKDRHSQHLPSAAITVNNNLSLANVDVLAKHVLLNIVVTGRNVSIPNFNSIPDNTLLSIQAISLSPTHNARILLQSGIFITRRGEFSEMVIYPGESFSGYKIGNNVFVLSDNTGLVECGKIEIQFIQPVSTIQPQGQLVNRQDYYRLFKFAEGLGMVDDNVWLTSQVNQAKFSSGNGTTTFRLPDLRGVFLRSFDAGRGIDAGRLNATIQTDAIKSHNHSFRDWYYPEANSPDATHKETMPLNYNNRIGSSGTDRDNTTVLYRDSNTVNAGGTETRPINAAYPIYIHY